MPRGLTAGIKVGALTAALVIAVVAIALAGSVKTRLVSVTSGGEPADAESGNPSVSASGRFVVFESRAENLPGSGNNADVYVHDRRTGKTRVASRTSAGEPVGNSHLSTLGGAISGSGRFVVFGSNHPELPGDHTGGLFNAYIHDRKTGRTRLISKATGGDPATGGAELSHDLGIGPVRRLFLGGDEPAGRPHIHQRLRPRPQDRQDDAGEQDVRGRARDRRSERGRTDLTQRPLAWGSSRTRPISAATTPTRTCSSTIAGPAGRD